MKILFVRPNKDSFGFKPIGLSLLSGVARDCGHKVKLFDTTEIDFGFIDNTASGEAAKIFKPVDIKPYDLKKRRVDLDLSFRTVLDEYRPDLLALSVLSDEYLIAAAISRITKDALPSLPVIWGGKFPTLNPEKTFNQCYADFVCVGEGIDAFREFIIALNSGNNLYKIPNIWARKNGLIIKNGIRPLKKDLDSIPYLDWTIFDQRHFLKPFDGKIYTGGDHMLNWGCPYHCSYCINHFYHTAYENKYFMRRYGIKRIIDELKYLKEQYQLKLFKFHDEDFLMRPLDNLQELSRIYKKEVNIPFVIETNPKSVIKEKVRLLKEMNCVSASIAIETGDANLRKKLLKRVDTEADIIRAFSLLKDAGIRTVSFNMLGIPFETRATYFKTVEVNRRAQVQYPNAGFFYPFEGTELRVVSIREGFFNPAHEEEIVYRRDVPALHFPNLSQEELIQLRNIFVLYVKLPRSFWPFIRLSANRDETAVILRRKLIEFYDKSVIANSGFYNCGNERKYLREFSMLAKRFKERAETSAGLELSTLT